MSLPRQLALGRAFAAAPGAARVRAQRTTIRSGRRRRFVRLRTRTRARRALVPVPLDFRDDATISYTEEMVEK
jgi:hypothetical protein